MCPDPDEDTPVACHMNPHWNQLQERFLVTTVRFILLLLGFSCDHPRFMLLPDNKEIWHINTAQGSFCHRCFYCALTYKVIAKFETFQEDLRLVNFCVTNGHVELQDQWNGPYFFLLEKSYLSPRPPVIQIPNS